MAIRQRAIQAIDKEERHRAILDAAERLLLRSPDRVASVAEVADEAGLGKGTVYLYFASKEELLLTVHERNLDHFFGALNALLEREAPVTIDDLVALTHEYIVRPPLFLPLAARCFALMAHSVPADAAAAFHERMAARLERGGAGLERRFARLAPGDGVAKLRHSFALILGLWQMSAASGCVALPPESGHAKVASNASRVFGWNYPDELGRALGGLWQTVAAVPSAAAT
jgi:AcrR family transcriptional regulator